MSDTVDMANSGPHEVPSASAKFRSATATVWFSGRVR